MPLVRRIQEAWKVCDFATRLGRAIYRKGISQRELAERVGVSPATISYWCNNGNWMSTKYLADTCRVLEVSADWLLFGEKTDGKNK